MALDSLSRILYAHKLEKLVRNFNHVFHKVLKVFRLFSNIIPLRNVLENI